VISSPPLKNSIFLAYPIVLHGNNVALSVITAHPKHTVIGSYGLAIQNALETLGYDASDLYQRAGIEKKPSNDPLARLTPREVDNLLKESVLVTGNPSFGLTVARFAHPSALHALGYSILASSSLRDCCERLRRYSRLATEQGELRTREDEHFYYLSSHRLSKRISPEAIDTWHAFLVRIFRTLYKPDFAPISVKLERPRPEGYEDIYHKAFHAPVSFDADYSEICLPLESVDVPLIGGNREIANQFDQLVENYLAELDETDIVTRTRHVIIEQLSSGSCNRQRVATELGLSSSSLQLRLAREETSFQALLDEVRKSIALAYMDQARIPITEIAFLVGFADTSSFSRIFRKWTGSSPSEYREKNH
jgi:AraC-like DNA-binding protein